MHQRPIFALLLVAAAACVPADESLPLGAAEFTVSARGSPRVLDPTTTPNVVDEWSIHVDRFLIGFRTMTIVNLDNSDQCAYRGRGALANVLFDGAAGSVVQSFDGIKPGDCPDVGMRLGSPDDKTVPGDGATAADLVALASGNPAHSLFEATATSTRVLQPGDPLRPPMRVSLRFDMVRTSSAFGGCNDGVRGVKIRPEARYAVFVDVAAEAFFRDAISASAQLRFSPFADADALGNNDGIVTMDELDALPLASAPGPFYELPSGGRSGSFGDYVRAQYQFAVKYGNGGVCNGLAAGTELEQ